MERAFEIALYIFGAIAALVVLLLLASGQVEIAASLAQMTTNF